MRLKWKRDDVPGVGCSWEHQLVAELPPFQQLRLVIQPRSCGGFDVELRTDAYAALRRQAFPNSRTVKVTLPQAKRRAQLLAADYLESHARRLRGA